MRRMCGDRNDKFTDGTTVLELKTGEDELKYREEVKIFSLIDLDLFTLD